MDLTFMGDAPTDVERDAVDALFPDGTPPEGSRRDLLLPALHAVMDAVGWVSRGALNHVCARLHVPPAEAYGVATFYAMFSVTERAPRVAHVCDDVACGPFGGDDIAAALEDTLGPPGADPERTWVRSPCLGLCEHSPAVMLQCAARPAGAPDPGSTARGEPAPTDPGAATANGADLSGAASANGNGHSGALTAVLPEPGDAEDRAPDRPSRDRPTPALRTVPFPTEPGGTAHGQIAPATAADVLAALDGAPAVGPEPVTSVPQAGSPDLRLLARVGVVDPADLDSYRAAGGYRVLRRALSAGPGRVVDEITTASLTGRGGAAFPTGTKWQAVMAAPVRPKYLVCNADESEPGTFKDRVLMEGDPFALVEAMTVAGVAVGAELGYLYVRGEYPTAIERMAGAIEAARTRGLLGADVMGSGQAFDIELRRGAGAYICGEETALLASLEGYRGEPRAKPPFPTVAGLFGKPTVINNVETLVNVLQVLDEGGAAFAAVGSGRSTGSKLFCLSGVVARPGVYEVPMGTTLRELLDLAGGVPPRLRTILLGGAAGSFVTPDQLDVPLTLEGTREIGASLGSGVVMAFDDTADMAVTLRRIAGFFRDESCGQCVPCRIGTVRQEESLARISRGRARPGELTLLDDVGRVMTDASICGLGQTAHSAVRSALDLGLLEGAP